MVLLPLDLVVSAVLVFNDAFVDGLAIISAPELDGRWVEVTDTWDTLSLEWHIHHQALGGSRQSTPEEGSRCEEAVTFKVKVQSVIWYITVYGRWGRNNAPDGMGVH